MKTFLIAAARYLIVGAIVVFLFFAEAGEPVSTADSDAVWDAVCAASDRTETQEGDNRMIRRLYGFDPAQYAFCGLYYPKTNMGADELLLVRLRDGQSDRDVLAATEKRLDAQKTAFEGYGAEQTELLTHYAVCDSYGGFVLFAVGLSAQETQRAFRTAAGG